MVHYNIIHIEDNIRNWAQPVQDSLSRLKLTYLNADSLTCLEAALEDNSADIFVVDGRFPENYGGIIEFLAPKAIEKIRDRYSDAKIVLYSADDDIGAKAKQYGVDFFSKRQVFANELSMKLKEMINPVL